jgi:hypothetical protein
VLDRCSVFSPGRIEAAVRYHLVRDGQLLLGWGIPATGVLETLLDRGVESDVAKAEAAIERLADAPADDGKVIREIWLLRLHALLAHAHGDEAGYRDYRDRYRAMATSLGFEGHMEWAEAMLRRRSSCTPIDLVFRHSSVLECPDGHCGSAWNWRTCLWVTEHITDDLLRVDQLWLGRYGSD